MKLDGNWDNASLETEIQICSDKEHKQQVAYSTYHDAITQVCFTCDKVRTSSKQLATEADN